jgi:hypothetical protein
MPQKENPVALAGADRAGIRYAEQQSFIRESVKNQAQQRLRRQRRVEVLHGLGARATSEFIAEIAADFGIEQHLDDRLEAYTTRLTPELLKLTGGHHFAPQPTRVVGGAR